MTQEKQNAMKQKDIGIVTAVQQQPKAAVKPDRKTAVLGYGKEKMRGVRKTAGGYLLTTLVPEGRNTELLLYRKNETEPCFAYKLDEAFCHGALCSVEIAPAADIYAYAWRIDGRIVPDPYAAALHEITDDRTGAARYLGLLAGACCVADIKEPAGGETPAYAPLPKIPYERSIFYKLHVRGFTKGARSGVRAKGTFAGLQEKIPYLKKLGVTSLILMPVYAFNAGNGSRKNYWGYTEGFYYAPNPRYSSSDNAAQEFCALVQALHAEGLECIPEFCFPQDYDPSQARNVLRYWADAYGVDGFSLIGYGPWLSAAMKDPLLCGLKMICQDREIALQAPEALQRRSRFSAVYTPDYAFTLRRFLKNDKSLAGRDTAMMLMANRSTAANLCYLADQDGFTLADVFSYNEKHNEENGEGGRDGRDWNASWNCGAEGPTRKKEIRTLRMRQLRNAVLLLMLSQGSPMLYAGDEALNTQNGNNNAWCQDNETGWVDWSRSADAGRRRTFTGQAVRFRKKHPVLSQSIELRGADYRSFGYPDVSFHGRMAWALGYDGRDETVGILLEGRYAGISDGDCDTSLFIIANMNWQPQTAAVPTPPRGKKWVTEADTSREEVFADADEAPASLPEGEKEIEIPPRTVMVLSAR